MTRAILTILLAVNCWGCGAADATAVDGVKNFQEGARTVLTSCSWRGEPTDEYDPREPGRCYNVVSWLDTRLSDHELADPCDAPETLDSTTLVRPDHGQLWGYFDRDKVDRYKILRFELLETCPP